MEMEQKVHEFPYRYTRMGAITKYVVVCLDCKKTLRPSRVERSKTGCHGIDYYVHYATHKVVAIALEQSNSGKRRITVPDELSEIRDLLEMTWLYETSDVNDVINAVKAYLMTMSKS
jgi:hypothetical protein